MVIREVNMAVCYFSRDYKKKYNCEYEIKDKIFEVIIDYDIMDEVESVNGIKAFGNDTEFIDRDILIIDYNNRKNYLLKNAYYCGHSSTYATPDGGTKTKFHACVVFEHNDYKKLAELLDTPKIKKVRLHSKSVNDLIGYPSLILTESKEKNTVELYKNKEHNRVEVNYNNIKSVSVADNWFSNFSGKAKTMQIDFDGYIEIELYKRANYDDAYDYIYELQIYLQLYYKNKFIVDKVTVMIEGEYYGLLNMHRKIDYTEKHVFSTVKEELLDFLKKCYTLIPYRKSKSEIRNIPYIIFKAPRNIEDSFLMYYRFIECYYKKQQISNIRKTFISYSIKEHYLGKHPMTDDEFEKYVQEIICLRKQYVHSGYFLKNSCLKVSFDKVNRRRNPKDYTVNNIDFDWVYKRTEILYNITIDIIFTRMLGYDEYTYS